MKRRSVMTVEEGRGASSTAHFEFMGMKANDPPGMQKDLIAPYYQ